MSKREDDKTIHIIYDGLNERGIAFTNEVYDIDSVDKLEEAISMLQSKGYINISVEYNDENYWLSECTIEEIEDYIREDMQVGRDVVENIEAVNDINIIPVYANRLENGVYGDIYTSYDECKAEHPDQEVIYGYYADIEDGPDFFETVYEVEDYIKGLDKEMDI